MSSCVNITNVTVMDNPAMFLNPFQFEISYECISPLKDDLEWKLVYVGCAEDEKYDQDLETVFVGPVNVGSYRFVFQADPPSVEAIKDEDILGVTAILLTCSYKGLEFIRIGYYVSNEYIEQELIDGPPTKVAINKVQRLILDSKPKVTKFPVSLLSLPFKQEQEMLCFVPPEPKCTEEIESDDEVDFSEIWSDDEIEMLQSLGWI
ncbi:hypothetical protein SUGI_0242440 [Cryptomeria japonica]|uniref:probable histone chaperone ASF1A n=1 Tax=Cryptomeria japonica TaxID=3369 RepID=UPI002408CD76|nr:probable histone chaperone ASF1A [Cryptomeria japonica]GLJ14898.1 hypothetical protein SUGI_0242440 [Cryptomeria japonica]